MSGRPRCSNRTYSSLWKVEQLRFAFNEANKLLSPGSDPGHQGAGDEDSLIRNKLALGIVSARHSLDAPRSGLSRAGLHCLVLPWRQSRLRRASRAAPDAERMDRVNALYDLEPILVEPVSERLQVVECAVAEPIMLKPEKAIHHAHRVTETMSAIAHQILLRRL